MPFKSEKIKIEGTPYDRRRKLTEKDKKDIQTMYVNKKSIRHITRIIGVSRRLIQFVIFPERKKIVAERARELKRWQKYNNKERHTPVIREHRRYKQELYKRGLINQKGGNNYMENEIESIINNYFTSLRNRKNLKSGDVTLEQSQRLTKAINEIAKIAEEYTVQNAS